MLVRPVPAVHLPVASHVLVHTLARGLTAELVGAQYLGQRNVIEPKGLNTCEAYPLDVRLLQKA